MSTRIDRRRLIAGSAATTIPIYHHLLFPFGTSAENLFGNETQSSFALKYLLASCMYGRQSLSVILPEVTKVGATAIDIWPAVHGNQREQIDEIGAEAFHVLLDQHRVRLGCITQYPLGPFGLQKEMKVARQFGCHTIVTGSRGPKELSGPELKRAVGQFADAMKPHVEVAAENGVTIAIENHANSLIHSPDSMKWLLELRSSDHLAIAFAPYHLPQDPALLSDLIRQLNKAIVIFYAWQYGEGCMSQLPKEKELLQLPGRGSLDFAPLLQALVDIQYSGWTEVFMHPFPRGIPIHETLAEVTAEINRSRNHLDKLLKEIE